MQISRPLVPILTTFLALTASALADPAPDNRETWSRPEADAPVTAADQARGWEEPPGVDGEDVVLFLPRVLLSVPRIATEVVFWPLRQAAVLNDRYAVAEHVVDVLYNDERTAAIVPTASYQSGFGPSFGASAFHKDLLGHEEKLKLKAAFGGLYQQAYQLSFQGDRVAGSRFWVESRARYEVNPGLLFRGLGDPPGADPPEGGALYDPSEADAVTRFRQDRFLGLLRWGYVLGQPGGLVKTGLTGIFNHRTFGKKQGDFGGDPSIEGVYDTAAIPGFDHGVDVLELNLNLIADFRDRPGRTSSGIYFELFGGGAPKLDEHVFWHYGAEMTGFVNLYRHTRILVLRAAVEATHGDLDDIPFTELPRLGGPHRLRGYRLDRFRDKVAAMGTVEYHYPIHERVAGELFVDAGQVGRTYHAVVGDVFEGETDAFEHWKTGYGAGFVVGDAESVVFRLDLSMGEGFQVFFSTDLIQAFNDRSRQL